MSSNEGDAVRPVAEAMDSFGFDEIDIDHSGNVCGIIHPPDATGPRPGRALLIDGHIDTIPLHSPDAWSEHPTHPNLGRRDLTVIDAHSSPYPSVSTVPGEVLAASTAGSHRARAPTAWWRC